MSSNIHKDMMCQCIDEDPKHTLETTLNPWVYQSKTAQALRQCCRAGHHGVYVSLGVSMTHLLPEVSYAHMPVRYCQVRGRAKRFCIPAVAWW